MKDKIRLYGTLFTPSGISLTLSIIFACATLFIYNVHYFLRYFEVNGSLRFGNFVLVRINDFLSSVFGVARIDNVVLITFWASVGLIVYFVGQVLVRDMGELSSDITAKHKYLWPKNSSPKLLRKFFERTLFSIAIILVLFIYIGHILSFFFRGRVSTIDIFGSGISSWLFSHGTVNDVAFVAAEVIALHGVVILLRLLFMRSRLFGAYGK